MKFITNLFKPKKYYRYTTEHIPCSFILKNLNIEENIGTQVAKAFYVNEYGWKKRWPRIFLVYEKDSRIPMACFRVSIKEEDPVVFESEEIPFKEYVKKCTRA